MPLNAQDIREQFPILNQEVDGNSLVYLDSAATAQVPQAVLDAVTEFETHNRANAHRGMHVLAERSTVAYENARARVAKFVHANRKEEIIFTKNCTEAINLVAKTWGMANLTNGDTIVLSVLEHHSNIVPWQLVAEATGAKLEWIECNAQGELDLDAYKKVLDEQSVKLVAITGQSNVLGVQTPLSEIISDAHSAGAVVLVDAAQLAAHAPIDVQELDCDFLAFSGHKLYGPTGIGVLYGKRALLESMPPFLGGGMMIQEVKRGGFSTAEIPAKFEAGTQPVAQAVGLAAALDWIGQYSWDDIKEHEDAMLKSAIDQLAEVTGLNILGPKNPIGCVSFVIKGVHPHDLTEILGRKGICMRAGHHCAQPLHAHLNINASTRVSVGIFNSPDEVSHLMEEIQNAASLIGG